MPITAFHHLLESELTRIDANATSKRDENIIEKFIIGKGSPRAFINGREYLIFNSNDYLGLRFHPQMTAAEHVASQTYGNGPGAVRFISGTLKVYTDLEQALAKFHNRQAAMIFSSAFAANIAAISCLARGQSKDSLVSNDTLIISDELNHRSIIEGIRVANLPSDQRLIFKHLDYQDLQQKLAQHVHQFSRVLIATDGIFSMLGENADLAQIQHLAQQFDAQYEQGVLIFVDDSHGIGVYGQRGRGCEEIFQTQAHLLVGTLGKAFGADGGYMVGDQILIDYLRESAATYIYSNPISPSVAAGALQSTKIINSQEGQLLLQHLAQNIKYFQTHVKSTGLKLANESDHPIQPLLIGDTAKTKYLTQNLFDHGILVTPINYPIVPPGRDEIRIQLSATHTPIEIDQLINSISFLLQTLK